MERRANFGKLELELLACEPLRNDIAAIQRKVGIGPQQPSRTDTHHPGECRQTDRHADRSAKRTRELLLRNGMRRRSDVRALHGRISQRPLKQPVQIGLVNPADPLCARAKLST